MTPFSAPFTMQEMKRMEQKVLAVEGMYLQNEAALQENDTLTSYLFRIGENIYKLKSQRALCDLYVHALFFNYAGQRALGNTETSNSTLFTSESIETAQEMLRFIPEAGEDLKDLNRYTQDTRNISLAPTQKYKEELLPVFSTALWVLDAAITDKKQQQYTNLQNLYKAGCWRFFVGNAIISRVIEDNYQKWQRAAYFPENDLISSIKQIERTLETATPLREFRDVAVATRDLLEKRLGVRSEIDNEVLRNIDFLTHKSLEK